MRSINGHLTWASIICAIVFLGSNAWAQFQTPTNSNILVVEMPSAEATTPPPDECSGLGSDVPPEDVSPCPSQSPSASPSLEATSSPSSTDSPSPSCSAEPSATPEDEESGIFSSMNAPETAGAGPVSTADCKAGCSTSYDCAGWDLDCKWKRCTCNKACDKWGGDGTACSPHVCGGEGSGCLYKKGTECSVWCKKNYGTWPQEKEACFKACSKVCP
jgi:hypothetical protein